MSKLKIFISAYACEPGLGSEIGVGWHWVLEMSRYFELWVLTRKSNQHTIEPWIAGHPEYSNIHFLYYDWPKWARFWKKGMQGVRLYYNLWQASTNGIVKRTMRENDIHIFHHLTYGNAVWPVSRYGSKQCFVWGPVSAGVMIPKDFTKHYRIASRCKEAIQRFVANTLSYNCGFHRRCKDAKLILCKTSHTIDNVPLRYRSKCVQFTDVAVEPISWTKSDVKKKEGIIHYLAAGTLVGWRNFDVLMLAFAKALKTNKGIRLTIVGGGDEYKKLSTMINDMKLNKYVKLTGQLKMDEYYNEMFNTDVVVNPCFREGAVTVSFDSMNFAKPLICFDTGGYTHYFKDEYSCVIRGVVTRADAINQLADRILFMADRNRIKQYGEMAHEAGKKYDWAHKGQEIKRLFEQLDKVK